MGKRFAISIGAAALGAALMAVGASADFRSVHDPRGDTTCGHEHGAHGPCSDRKKRNADIVRATAGHDGIWLKHTIRVVGKFQAAELVISPDSDPPLCVGAFRGVGAWSSYISECSSDVVTGHARMDFHRHSVEILFSKGSIGRPQSYGWSVLTWAGDSRTFANDQVPNVQGRQIRHRLGQPAAKASAGVDKHNTVKIDSRVTWDRSTDKPTFIGLVRSSKPACRAHRLVKVFERTHGPDRLVGKDRSNRRGKWRVIKELPGLFYAKALRREVRIAGTTFVCRADRSKVIDTH